MFRVSCVYASTGFETRFVFSRNIAQPNFYGSSCDFANSQMPSYVPIIRSGPVERTALSEFWNGLTRFEAGPEYSLSPFLELTDRGEDLDVLKSIGDRLFLDIPTYLLERRTKHTEDVEDLIDEYGTAVEFFQNEDIDPYIPVVSTDSTDIIEYDTLLTDYQSLRDDFEVIAIRPFVGGPELDEEQRRAFTEIINEIRPIDVIFLDIIDVTGFEGSLYANLEFITNLTSEFDTYALNAFQPREGRRNHNYGPVLADDLGLDGFGDFVLEPRFPSAGGQPTDTRIIRHYSPDQFDLEMFISEGGGYEEALDQLRESDYWDSNHCQFCREANSDWNEGHRFWKRIRMGHYLHAIYLDTFQMMGDQTGEDLDMDGYQYVHRRVEDDD